MLRYCPDCFDVFLHKAFYPSIYFILVEGYKIPVSFQMVGNLYNNGSSLTLPCDGITQTIRCSENKLTEMDVGTSEICCGSFCWLFPVYAAWELDRNVFRLVSKIITIHVQNGEADFLAIMCLKNTVINLKSPLNFSRIPSTVTDVMTIGLPGYTLPRWSDQLPCLIHS